MLVYDPFGKLKPTKNNKKEDEKIWGRIVRIQLIGHRMNLAPRLFLFVN